ncbi:MAG: TetR/AcrR family transcriptional regulator [Ramlibacter sp.]|nr:TetR/AcrR family transcriptional regulator [Ramlibacter sp.]
MPRPGQNIEQALLRSGRQLYAERGAQGLSVRALAEHAGVTASMFHYHFKNKDEFLRQLLQSVYEEMFEKLSDGAQKAGPTFTRLRAALRVVAGFVRDNAAVLGRVLTDAASGQQVAIEFMRSNAPRHLKVLLALMDEAQQEGALVNAAPMQRFIFVMSAVAMPLVIVPGVLAVGLAPELIGEGLRDQVMSDAAIDQRIEFALKAIAAPRRRT